MDDLFVPRPRNLQLLRNHLQRKLPVNRIGLVQSCWLTSRSAASGGGGRLQKQSGSADPWGCAPGSVQFSLLVDATTPAISSKASGPPPVTCALPAAGDGGGELLPLMLTCAQPAQSSRSARARMRSSYPQARRSRSHTAAHSGDSGGASMRIA